MKTLPILLAALLVWQFAGAEPCLPEGIMFTSQTQVNNFRINYPGCTQIGGDVVICGSNITNLNGLNVLTSIGGDLKIECNGVLTSLSGLENITSVGGDVYIAENASLTSLSHLANLNQAGGDITVTGNPLLTSLDGCQGITSVPGMLWIDYNDALQSMAGLDNVSQIGGFVRISANSSLVSLEGLNALTSVGGSLVIGGMGHTGGIGNPQLASLSALMNLQTIGGSLIIAFNTLLPSLSGIDNIQPASIGELSVFSNSQLSTCEVQSVCDYLALPGSVVNISDNAPGCSSPAEVISACELLGSPEGTWQNLPAIHPNPCNDLLTIHTGQASGYRRVVLYNLRGQPVATALLHPGLNTVNTTQLDPGHFCIIVEGGEKLVRRTLLKR